MKFLICPAEGQVRIEDLPDTLDTLQGLVGGFIQAVPLPGFIPDSSTATCYINEEGKYDPECKPNMRATDFFVPGIGLFMGDYIAGTAVFCGFDPSTGENRDVPAGVVERWNTVALEATGEGVKS